MRREAIDVTREPPGEAVRPRQRDERDVRAWQAAAQRAQRRHRAQQVAELQCAEHCDFPARLGGEGARADVIAERRAEWPLHFVARSQFPRHASSRSLYSSATIRTGSSPRPQCSAPSSFR
jgi:hypothetical protein